LSTIEKPKAGSKKVNYAEMIVVKLREDIVSGRLRPNERQHQYERHLNCWKCRVI